MIDQEQFVALTERLVNGLLREAIGYRVEYPIHYYRGIVGYMVEAPMLWIRHFRFPILFVAFDADRRSEVLNDIVKQVEIAKATEFFALLIVVPAGAGSGNEAEELRQLVSDSAFRFDFVVLEQEHLASIIANNSSQRLIEIILSQGVELSALSPYVFKGPVPDKMFFGRETEVKEITRMIENRDYTIVGGRRIGKSSTLLKIDRLLNNDPRYRAIYFNCEDKFDYEDLFQALGEEFQQDFDGYDPLNFRKFAATLQKESAPRQVVILLDEIDELLAFDSAAQPAGQLFKTFRALSHGRVCRFVFSGSRTLYKHLHQPNSPFFNFCEDITLRPLEKKSVAEIVRKPMRQLGIEILEEEELIARMIDLTSCHPNVVQWLCDRLVKAAASRQISPKNLEEISSHTDFYNHFLQTSWGEATPLEKLISLVIDDPAFESSRLLEELASHGITDKRSIQDGLEMLQVYSLLERHGDQYRFVSPHFSRIARTVEDVHSQIETLLNQVEA